MNQQETQVASLKDQLSNAISRGKERAERRRQEEGVQEILRVRLKYLSDRDAAAEIMANIPRQVEMTVAANPIWKSVVIFETTDSSNYKALGRRGRDFVEECEMIGGVGLMLVNACRAEGLNVSVGKYSSPKVFIVVHWD